MSEQESTRERLVLPGPAPRLPLPAGALECSVLVLNAAFSNLLSSPSLFRNRSQSGGGSARCALPDPACWGAEVGVQGPSTRGSRLLQDTQKLSGPEDSWPASARSITDGAVGSRGTPGRCLTATSGPMLSTQRMERACSRTRRRWSACPPPPPRLRYSVKLASEKPVPMCIAETKDRAKRCLDHTPVVTLCARGTC